MSAGRASLAGEVFLWIAVVLLSVAGIVAVFGDDLTSRTPPPASAAAPGSAAPAPGPGTTRP